MPTPTKKPCPPNSASEADLLPMNSATGLAIFFSEPQPYVDIERLQLKLAGARFDNTIPDTVLFLEHQPVITLGRRGRQQHLLVSPEHLQRQGILLYQAKRGGDVTYHAPGQCILYPILRLGELGADAHGYLHNLEEVAIRTCADFGIQAWRVEGKNGAWTEAGKIAAIGFNIKRGITMNGMSLNVSLDMSGFQWIVPCGLVGDPVCSMAMILGDQAPQPDEVRGRLRHQFEHVFGRELQAGASPLC